MEQIDYFGGQTLREMFSAATSWLEKSASDIDVLNVADRTIKRVIDTRGITYFAAGGDQYYEYSWDDEGFVVINAYRINTALLDTLQ